MPYETKYKSRAHNVTCDICGFVMKSTDVRLNWQGFLVCEADFEKKHDQLEIPMHPKFEGQPKGVTQGEQDDTFIAETKPLYDSPVPGSTVIQILAASLEGNNAIIVDSITGVNANDVIYIELDDDTIQVDTVASTADIGGLLSITINGALGSGTTIGDYVYTIAP